MRPQARHIGALAAIAQSSAAGVACGAGSELPEEIVEGVPGSSAATPAITDAPLLDLPPSAVSTR